VQNSISFGQSSTMSSLQRDTLGYCQIGCCNPAPLPNLTEITSNDSNLSEPARNSARVTQKNLTADSGWRLPDWHTVRKDLREYLGLSESLGEKCRVHKRKKLLIGAVSITAKASLPLSCSLGKRRGTPTKRFCVCDVQL
jgi:hypothetical protein